MARRKRKPATNESGDAEQALVNQYAVKITAAWQKSVSSIIEVGKLLIEAKAKLPHGQWLNMLGRSQVHKPKGRLPFKSSTAEALMRIARHPVLANSQFIENLPPSWGTLSDLAAIPAPELKRLIANGKVHAGMQRADVRKLGFYVIHDTPRLFLTLIKLAANYPEPALYAEDLCPPGCEHLNPDWESLVRRHYEELGALGPWITRLHEAIGPREPYPFDKLVARDAAIEEEIERKWHTMDAPERAALSLTRMPRQAPQKMESTPDVPMESQEDTQSA